MLFFLDVLRIWTQSGALLPIFWKDALREPVPFVTYEGET